MIEQRRGVPADCFAVHRLRLACCALRLRGFVPTGQPDQQLGLQSGGFHRTALRHLLQHLRSRRSTHGERLAFARSRVIVVDLWTDTNNWAAIADPRMYPTIGLGFRYGRQPEIFSVASPLAGLMFSNDTLPVKVRFFYAVGPMDYRGMYKENVT